jgi:peptidoglycan/xylan/chitin deacetylase (PgdA/CDA1 family)
MTERRVASTVHDANTTDVRTIPEMSRYDRTFRQAVHPRRTVLQWARTYVRSGLLAVASKVYRDSQQSFLRCLYCHYVFDDQIERFGALVDTLMQSGTFVDTATAVQMVEGTRPVDGAYFHLSFDDGFRNNVNAARVLRERGIPAAFFIPTGLIGGSWEVAKEYCQVTMNYGGVIELMDWSHVEQLRDWGFDVGSHTRTHAKLSNIGGDRLQEEIIGSRHDLQQRLGSCDYLSWPYGARTDVHDEALRAIRDAGYRASFGAFRARVIAGETDILRIPRHHFEADWPVGYTRLFAHGFGENR